MQFAAVNFSMWMAADNVPRWLTFSGPSGTGKTYLAKQLFEWFKINLNGRQYLDPKRENHIEVKTGNFEKWPKCVDKLNSGRYGLVDGMIEDWFLVIDDIGAEHDPRKFGVTNLLKILDGREKKWTVLTTNLSLKELGDKADVRIASRLIRGHSIVVETNVKDYNG